MKHWMGQTPVLMDLVEEGWDFKDHQSVCVHVEVVVEQKFWVPTWNWGRRSCSRDVWGESSKILQATPEKERVWEDFSISFGGIREMKLLRVRLLPALKSLVSGYSGVFIWTALCVIQAVLKMHLLSMGSQLRLQRAGEVWSSNFIPVRSLAPALRAAVRGQNDFWSSSDDGIAVVKILRGLVIALPS